MQKVLMTIWLGEKRADEKVVMSMLLGKVWKCILSKLLF
jgi:hypothetical protein